MIRALASIVLVALLMSAWAGAQAPSNDSCAGALPIGNGFFPGTNVGATTGPDPVGSCGSMANDVWYAYTASCTGIATAAFCPPGNAGHDTVLTAWSGSCGALTEIVCNDDSCSSLQSRVSWPVTSGTVYYISAGGFSGDTGSFVLSLSCSPPIANDLCSSATPVVLGLPVTGTNLGASTGGDPVVVNCGNNNSFDLWYSYLATCTGPHQATTCHASTNFDTVVGVWSGICGSLTPVVCNDDDPTGCPVGQSFGLESRVSFTATFGTLYYISVAGYNGNQGNFGFTVQGTSAPMSLSFINSGPGTIGYQVTSGPGFGLEFTVVTLNQGNYPNGWFFGIACSTLDIVNEYNTGYPFIAALDGCGAITVGPFGPLPAGLTVYGVTLGGAPGSQVAGVISAPASGTVP